MKLLGIDYGKKNIGVAYSEGIYAQPFIDLHTNEAMVRLTKLCQEKEIEKVIVGKPEGFMANQVQVFTDMLKKTISCEVIVWDETLSSKDAQSQLVAQHGSRAKRKAKEHKVAAALILQSYIDSGLDR